MQIQAIRSKDRALAAALGIVASTEFHLKRGSEDGRISETGKISWGEWSAHWSSDSCSGREESCGAKLSAAELAVLRESICGEGDWILETVNGRDSALDMSLIRLWLLLLLDPNSCRRTGCGWESVGVMYSELSPNAPTPLDLKNAAVHVLVRKNRGGGSWVGVASSPSDVCMRGASNLPARASLLLVRQLPRMADAPQLLLLARLEAGAFGEWRACAMEQ